jgi:trehalose/maltose hydrolase-like predicted phosphorylase
MSTPLNPPTIERAGRDELPAYVSNGCIGLRVLDIPLLPGVVLVNGFAGMHSQLNIEAASEAPHAIAGDLKLGGVRLTLAPQLAEMISQDYDFATGELTTRFRYATEAATATVEVLTFASRPRPWLLVQEVIVEVDRPVDLEIRALVDTTRILGRKTDRETSPGGDAEAVDGAMEWESLGGISSVGVAYATDFAGDKDVQRKVVDWGRDADLATDYVLRAHPGRRYRLRQMASVVPSVMHHDPDREAIRHAARAAHDGFEALRKENRAAWAELWRGRIVIDADDVRWQQLADAAFFYLNSSVHASAPSSTSIYGLAMWKDYHYYYGHVMWDVDFFGVPPLLMVQPDAAYALLEFRAQTIKAARGNAKLHGRRGIQFPWETGPRFGEEASPGAGHASWHEDHVSLDVAWAFAQYAHATGDERFLAESAAPVLYGVADWIVSRVVPRRGGFDWPKAMGIAERPEPSDNEAFTLLAAQTVLDEAIACATRLGTPVSPRWVAVRRGLTVPMSERTGAVMSHDGYHPREQKGATPGPLAGIFPLWSKLDAEVERATLDYYLGLAPGYVGSPMLSPLYGVWACWAGDRRLAARLYEQGYAELVGGRFEQTFEQSPTRYPEKPPSGPFFANIGGFLMGLLYGLPGIRLSSDPPETWPSRPVVLPAGWRSIEVERVWIHGEPAGLAARHGAKRAELILPAATRRAGKAA